MAQHTDATGYLLDLRSTQAEAWFESVCDLAVSSAGQNPQLQQLENLWELFHGTRAYTPIAAIPPALSAPSVPLPPRFLEKLSNFSSYKRLSPDLSLQLSKQVTLIFGKNGSGKTSICQALKVLSNSESPVNPLHNARETARPLPIPSFAYLLNSVEI